MRPLQNFSIAAIPFVLLMALALVAPAAASNAFVTGPADGSPLDIALAYLDANRVELGLDAGDIADFSVGDQYVTEHNGVTHVYLQQLLDGIEVVNGLFNVNVMPDGRILNFGNRFVSGLAGAVNTRSAALEHEDAIVSAARHFELEVDRGALRIVEAFGGPAEKIAYDGAGISQDAIPVELKYLPLEGGSARLVWSLVIRRIETPDWWNVFVDAQSGEVLDKFNWTAYEADREEEGGCTSNCYRVYAIPKESPDDGNRTIEDNPADAIASPFGWHDTDGAAGAEFTDTRGNNVEAQTDLDANNNPAGETRGEGGPNLIFNDVLNLNAQPSNYQAAAVTNLFYWNSILHDVLYQYGFDEASGNFQFNNYGNGGLGSDPVQADAQDGSGTNNANFGTPPDGNEPRMQMFVWTNPFGQLATVNSPPPIVDSYVANPSNNGGTGNGLTADLEIVVDGTPPTTDACEAVLNDLTGKIAVIVWNEGACNSSVFVANAATAGAVAAIIVDNTDEPFTNFGGSAAIPSVAVGMPDGQLFIDTIEGGDTVNATLEDNPAGQINRDSDLDNGVIAHEYGHGVSNRLTGGPANVNCLNHQEQAGEGWSDWWALTLFPLPSDTETTTRGLGNYVTFRPIDGSGIRNFPYTTDIGVNPQTYADIGTTNVPHGVGEIWAVTLWEMYWNLVNRYGFDEDLYTGTGGNNLAIQLVIDGMKLQPCSPTFVDARDAILAADMANNANANECEIWNAFAKRGVGFSADAGGTGVGDETEAFDLPPGVPAVCVTIFQDGFESGDTTAWSSTVP